MNVLMSIKPEYVEKILNGEKRFEYRKTIPKKDIDKIIIYATTPIKKVVGEVSVKRIIIDDKLKVWEETKKYSGTSKDFFLAYYNNREVAVAYELVDVKIYNPTISLKDLNINFVPQSFIYLD